MPLEPGSVLPKDMDQRHWARWNRQQVIADTNTVNTSALQEGAVTWAKIQDVTADRILGRLSTDGDVTELTATQVAGLLDGADWAFTGTVTFSGNMGFFGATAVAQQSDPGGYSRTVVSGTGDDANINTNFQDIQNKLNAIRGALVTLGLIA